MNTVWNSYGQLLQLPEKTSKKMQIETDYKMSTDCKRFE